MFVATDWHGRIRWTDLRNRRTRFRVVLVTALVLSATYGAAAWLWLGGEVSFDHTKCQTIADMIEAGTLGRPGDYEVVLPPQLRNATLLGRVSIGPPGHFRYFEMWHRHGASKGYTYCPAPHSTPVTEAEISRDLALIRSVFSDTPATTVSPTKWTGWYYVTVHGY
jgi:hypothetical protein